MNVNLGSTFEKFFTELTELRKEIAIGIEQTDRGEFVDGPQAFDKIRQRSTRGKRSNK
jgi:hypothetical protein